MKIQIKTKSITIRKEMLHKLDELVVQMIALTGDDDMRAYIELTAEKFDQSHVSACMPLDKLCFNMAMSSVTFKTVEPVDKLKEVKKIYDEKISMLEADIKQLRHELQALT